MTDATRDDDRNDPDLPLLHAAAGGDGGACRALVDRHLQRLHAFASRVLDDAAEAEDVCQDAFMKLWQFASQWDPRARVRTWLYQVALNGCRDRLRRRRPHSEAEPDELPTSAAGPERRHTERTRAQAVHAALNALPARQREAMLLCHYEGHTNPEAAAMLDVSVDALESLLARAKRALRERLAALAATEDGESA